MAEPRAALIFSAALFAGAPSAEAGAMCRRFASAGVALAAFGSVPAWLPTGLVAQLQAAPWSPRLLLLALQELAADPLQSWLVTGDAAGIAAAGSAGLAGVVLVGAASAPADSGVWVRQAPDLAGVPIALVPRGGGCWHQR